MKIASWNVNGIRASLKKGLEDFIHKERPDILCLQETKAHPDQLQLKGQSDWERKNFYPFRYWSVCGKRKGYSGTAIFSQREALKVSKGIGIKKFDYEGRILIFELKEFILINIYFPNGALNLKRHLFKQEFLSRLTDFLQELRVKNPKELMIVGDYNTAYLDIDVHSPKRLSEVSGFLPEERQWFQGFLKQGYVDIYRQFYPDKKSIYTWWSMREKARENNRGWRIDHICTTLALLPKINSVEILTSQKGSDHCPIIVEGDF